MLTVSVAFQATSPTDATLYTTSSQTPVSGDLYVIFVNARAPNEAWRVPTVTGTNGWSNTWNRVAAAQATYVFNPPQAFVNGGIECFWGVATSGTAGTLTVDYGSGTAMRANSWHVLRLGGNVNKTSPIGATASAASTGSTSGLTTQLTSMPARNSIILGAYMSDLNNSLDQQMPGGFTLLGTLQVPVNTAVSRPFYEDVPLTRTVGVFLYGPSMAQYLLNDTIGISAVEILDLAPEYTDRFPLTAKGAR